MFDGVPNVRLEDELKERIEHGASNIDLEKALWLENDQGKSYLKVLTTPAAVRNVRELHAARLKLDDKGLAVLSCMHLTNLDISHSKVADLYGIKDMKTLQQLNVSSCPITSKGMSVIGGLTNIQIVHLDGTPIHDSDLRYLYNLKRLWHLNLRNCHSLTPKGIEALKKQKPQFIVEYSDPVGKNPSMYCEWYLVRQQMVVGEPGIADQLLTKFLQKAKPVTILEWIQVAQAQEMRAACQADLGHPEEAHKLFLQAISTYEHHQPSAVPAAQQRYVAFLRDNGSKAARYTREHLSR